MYYVLITEDYGFHHDKYGLVTTFSKDCLFDNKKELQFWKKYYKITFGYKSYIVECKIVGYCKMKGWLI